MGLRLIAILLCLVLIVGIIPIQVFADDGDGGEEIDETLRASASLCFTNTASYYKPVPIVKGKGCALLVKTVSENKFGSGNVTVELYEKAGDQKTLIGTAHNQPLYTWDKKPSTFYTPFD